MPSVLFRLTVMSAALAAVAPAVARQAGPPAAPAKKTDDQEIQKVVVKGSADTYNPRRDDTATKIIINSDEITKFGDTNVMDVLKRLPGVSVGGGGIRMRGLGGGYTQFLLNGERPPIGFSTDQIPPDQIERIEVMRAASAEYSTQSIAGTINIVLKTAVRFKPNARLARSVNAGVMTGNGAVSPSVGMHMSEPIGNFGYSVSANASRNRSERGLSDTEEGFDPAGGLIRLRGSKTAEQSDNTFLSLAPRVTWTLENGETLTLQSSLFAGRIGLISHRDIDSMLGIPSPYRSVDLTLDNDTSNARTDFSWLHKLGGGARLDLKAGANFNGRRADSHRRALAAGGVPVLDDLTRTESDETGFTSIGKYTTPIVEGHSLGAGWDLGVTTRDEDRNELVGRGSATPVATDEDYRSKVNRVAVYAQDEWNVTPRWSVYAGARWEGIQTISSGNTFVTSDSRTRVFSPLFHTLYKLPGKGGDQLRMALTRTFKAPATQLLIPRGIRSLNNRATEPDYLGNPELKPELALGLDASYEHYWAKNALLSASVTVREIDDYTRNGLVLMDDGRWAVLPLNRGKAHVRSIELEAKFPLKELYAGAPPIELRANVARNWSWVDSIPGPNNRLDSQTPVTANAGFDYRSGQLTTGGSFNFATGGLVQVSNEQSRYQSVKRDLEAYLMWRFKSGFNVRFAAQNILAQDVIQDVRYDSPTTSYRTRSVAPGQATLRVTVDKSF
ncbi:MAG: TonB-dependent receptor plug domain-containing protein [Telluria sp.]